MKNIREGDCAQKHELEAQLGVDLALKKV